MNRWTPGICLVGLLSWAAVAGPERGDGGRADAIVVGSFTSPGKELPEGWNEQTFDPKKIPIASLYEQVTMGNRTVLKGTTHQGASLIYRSVDIDWRRHPILAWRWRVDQVFEKEDERSKAGDDFPARIYIGFKYDPNRVNWFTRRAFERARRASKDGSYPPLYTITYVWATKEPINSAYSNPFQDRAKMVVVRSGNEGLKAWHEEERNYLEDFRAILGEDPPEVEFVAIMIDGDNTGSSGVCYFDDIRFLPQLPRTDKTMAPEE